jgi:hypothetical protein
MLARDPPNRKQRVMGELLCNLARSDNGHAQNTANHHIGFYILGSEKGTLPVHELTPYLRMTGFFLREVQLKL